MSPKLSPEQIAQECTAIALCSHAEAGLPLKPGDIDCDERPITPERYKEFVEGLHRMFQQAAEEVLSSR